MPEIRWIADASFAALALWVSLILTGAVLGTFASRWHAADASVRGAENLLLAAAAAGVIAWFANAGSLLGGATSHPLLTAQVPIDVRPGYRLAVLWATLPGCALTVAVALLVLAALSGRARDNSRTRYVAALAAIALVALIVAVWFAPQPNAASTRIPAFVQAASAALAPLFALGALVILADMGAARLAGAPPHPYGPLLAWSLATAALVAEQIARSRLGIGPREAIVLGSASSGLVLWLVTSALLHGRVQMLLFGIPQGTVRNASAPLAAHIGSALLVLSFALHAFAARATVSIAPGASVEVTDSFRRTWELANQGVSRFDDEGADVLSLALEATKSSGAHVLLTPEIRDYHGGRGQHLDNTIGRRQSTGAVAQTLRVLLVEADSLDVASVRVTFLPLPILWPIGIGLLGVSLLLTLRYSRTPRPE
jgi:hypothetical protein